MSPLLTAILLAGLAGLSMPLGGLLARWEHISDARLRDGVLHAITAFGGGALLSAVALVLVPHGAEALSPLVALSLLAAGGLVFAWVDTTLNRIGGSGALLLAMVLDFLPEAMALGAMLVSQSSTAILLAVMIFLQNLPEGFAAFRDMWQRDRSELQVLMVFVGLAALGPFCAIAGLVWLADMPDVLGGSRKGW